MMARVVSVGTDHIIQCLLAPIGVLQDDAGNTGNLDGLQPFLYCPVERPKRTREGQVVVTASFGQEVVVVRRHRPTITRRDGRETLCPDS